MLKPGQVQANWDIWSPYPDKNASSVVSESPVAEANHVILSSGMFLAFSSLPGEKERNWGCVGGTYANPKAVQLSVVTWGGHSSCPRPVVSTLGWTLDRHKRRIWVGGKQGS